MYKQLLRCVLLLLLLSGCSQQEVYPSIEAALEAVPPYDLSAEDKAAARIIQQEQIPEGVVVLYAWHRAATDTYGLTTAFISKESNGWVPQSSGWMESSSPLLPAEDAQAAELLQISGLMGGNIRPLSAMSGVSHVGERVRVTWVDGEIREGAIHNRSFLVPRLESILVHKIEVLDAQGAVVTQKEF